MRVRTILLVSGLVAVCSGLGLGAPPPAQGEGFRVLDHGAAAVGQGAAFAAQADDPSALHYNPAAMPDLSRLQIYFGGLFVAGDTTFTNTAGVTVHGGPDGTFTFPPPATFFLTASSKGFNLGVSGELALGVGVTSPFGLQITYPTNGPLSTVTTFAALPLLDIKPTIAYRFNRYFSVGAGLDIYTFSDLIGEGQA